MSFSAYVSAANGSGAHYRIGQFTSRQHAQWECALHSRKENPENLARYLVIDEMQRVVRSATIKTGTVVAAWHMAGDMRSFLLVE